MKINEVIFKRRKELKMTQKDLADKLNVTDKTVSRWENGTTLPDVEMLKTIAEVLELDIMDFYKDVDTKEINHSEKYDLSIISKYRTIMIINVVSLIVLLLIHILVIIYIGKLTTSLKTDHIIYHENIKDILLEINKTNLIEFMCMSIALLGSVSCVIGTNIWFKAKYTDKLYQDVYIEVKHKYQLIYYILFAFLFDIILVGYFI